MACSADCPYAADQNYESSVSDVPNPSLLVEELAKTILEIHKTTQVVEKVFRKLQPSPTTDDQQLSTFQSESLFVPRRLPALPRPWRTKPSIPITTIVHHSAHSKLALITSFSDLPTLQDLMMQKSRDYGAETSTISVATAITNVFLGKNRIYVWNKSWGYWKYLPKVNFCSFFIMSLIIQNVMY